MQFCTTCGRTYEDPEIDICPHDGTPLFSMAGSEGRDLPDEEAEAIGDEADESPSLEALAAEPAPGLHEDFSEGDEDDLALDDSGFDDPQLVPLGSEGPDFEDDLFVSPSESADEPLVATAEEPSELLFGDDEDAFETTSTSQDFDPFSEDLAFKEGAQESSSPDLALQGDPVVAASKEERELFEEPAAEEAEHEELFGEPQGELSVEEPRLEELKAQDRPLELPGADEAASLQISEAIDTTLGDLGEDSELPGDASLADAYTPSSLPQDRDLDLSDERLADPLENHSSGRGGLLAVLVLILLAAAIGWYFLLGPGAGTAEVVPTPTPDVIEARPAEPITPEPAVIVAPDMASEAALDAGALDAGVDAEAAQGLATPPPVEKPKPRRRKKPAAAEVKAKAPAEVKAPVKSEAPAENPPLKPAVKEKLDDELNNLLE